MSEQQINTLAPNDLPEAKPAEDQAHPAMQGLAKLSLARQLGLMLGLAFLSVPHPEGWGTHFT